ncbi:Protein kinase, catalytic domain-containing protein, partial [Cynara cardunculus var. scolymus]
MPLESSISDHEPDDSDTDFVEIDPSGRYGRYKEVLGKGAFKKVYKAFDELEGIEVAWNQIKFSDFLRNPDELERLYSEVHLLKTLKHKNIIKFYNSWGVKPASLAKVKDPGVKSFIEKCIAKVSDRLSAKELLMDPFLRDDHIDGVNKPGQPNLNPNPDRDAEKLDNGKTPKEFMPLDSARDFTVKGHMKDLNTVFLKLRIEDTTGHVRNIHFPFDTDLDTSIAVASEMVEELDLTDQDVSTIAEMIDAEIQSCIPDWAPRDYYDDQEDNEAPGSVDSTSEPQNESTSPLTIKSSAAPGCLALERLPSGRRYWSDSPKSCFSPLRPRPSNASEDNTQSGAICREEQHSSKDDDDDDDDDNDNDDNDDDNDDNDDDNDDDDSDDVKEMEEPLQEEDDDDRKGKGEDKDDEVENIVEKVEHLLVEQQKELDELKKKHGLIVSNMLNKLPPGTRKEVANICKVNISEATFS